MISLRYFRDAVALAKMTPLRIGDRSHHCGYVGWVGHENLGDEVMFEAARSLLGSQLEILGTRNCEVIWHQFGLGGVSRYPFVFLGGGTLVGQGYLSIVEALIKQGARLATLGTGAGSPDFNQLESPIDARWVSALSQFERVGVRGPLSVAKLRDAGLSGAEVIGDLALALTPAKPVPNWQSRCILVNSAIGRSPVDTKWLSVFNSAVAKLLRELSKSGWRIIPVALHPSDFRALREVLQDADLVVPKIEMPRTFEDYTQLAMQASASVGVRLHSSILASACGLPNILSGYRDKCMDFAASVDTNQTLMPLEGFQEAMLFDAFEGIASNPARVGVALHEACLNYRSRIQNYVRDLT